MNLGQAVAVSLYELIRREDSEVAAPAAVREARSEDVERVGELLLEALHRSGYVKDLTAESSALKVRRLVGRMKLSDADAGVWLGMMRQILWKLRGPE